MAILNELSSGHPRQRTALLAFLFSHSQTSPEKALDSPSNSFIVIPICKTVNNMVQKYDKVVLT